MILTQCAACAKPLAHDAPRCVRCWTRYCDASCQLEHWNNGHKKQCKKIARGRGAEQFHADAKYKEALDAAVVDCRPNIPADAICYICRNDASAQGLVTGCGCHGGDGIAHVTCLMRMAQLAVKDYVETGSGEGIQKWQKCFDCGQSYHSAVSLALGWGCWKTYLGRPETDWHRCIAMGVLAKDLGEFGGDCDAALAVLEVHIMTLRRFWPEYKEPILVGTTNLANIHENCGRYDAALDLKREVFAERRRLLGPAHELTITAGINLTIALRKCRLYAQAEKHARRLFPVVRRTMGDQSEHTIRAACSLADSLALRPGATRSDVIEAEGIYAGVLKAARQIFGPDHPVFVNMCRELECLQRAVAQPHDRYPLSREPP